MGAIASADIRRIRSRRGWTQAELARAMGTDPVTVSRWERGASRPRRMAQKLLRALLVEFGPESHEAFVEDPATRLRRLESALRDQLQFKQSVRLGP